MIDLEALFDKHEDEFLKFDRVENPAHPRPDLAAFILLDRLVPHPGRDMVSSAEHDEIYLEVEPSHLAEVATEDDVLTLIRCGLRFDTDTESFCMFV